MQMRNLFPETATVLYHHIIPKHKIQLNSFHSCTITLSTNLKRVEIIYS